ncbi:pimeloyl-CoA synthetase [Sphaerisporangium rufum]|uniref:Pimeloyl-CoA synthetase n=1 Tax=Sphaerisporangium rufum TaxID=1381558 RepID=A0A919V1F8_9ACTN|nr:acetate--CoA ligase family protein [Sphaerisporangium rufum]GII78552.1 pimeloyl-CoA synthetase [Sphaerisporangium rufum]
MNGTEADGGAPGGGDRRPAGTAGPDLRGFFTPRRVALIGASESSGWTGLVLAGADRSPGLEEMILVNPRRATVHGRPAIPSLAALDRPADLAFVMVGPDRVAGAVRDALAAGTRDLVVLSAGLGEAGAEGGTRQRHLAELCAAGGARLLGPNVSGFVNPAGGVTLFGLPVPADLPAGRVGVVMQSGGLATHVLGLARSWGIGLSLLATTGNEAVLTATDVLDHLVDDEGTGVVAVFLESVRDPAAFRAVALRAAGRGKPIVALHAGTSTLGRAAALSHTGALVGDHALTAAALEDLGVVLVRSMEELVATAALLAHHPRGLGGRRLAVVAASGGACELIADAAEPLGFTLPPFSGELAGALAAALPPFADVRNPLDVTGYVVKAADLPFTATELVDRHGAGDHDALILQSVVLPAGPGPDEEAVRARFRRLAGAVRGATVPVVLQTGAVFALSPFALELVMDNDLVVLPGIAAGMAALDRAARYAEILPRALRDRSPAAVPAWAGRGDVAELLARCGVPVPPERRVRTAGEAARAAAELGFPVVLKVVSDDVPHKSDVGGVVLGLAGPAAVSEAFSAMMAEVSARLPGAALDGALVAPMRPPGVELLVSVVNDPRWGLLLTVGSGGVLAELLDDVVVRPLPVAETEIPGMLAGLRVARLLGGYRGSAPADLPAVTAAIVGVQRLAGALGPDLRAVEINPLWVRGEQVEALDVLLDWAH